MNKLGVVTAGAITFLYSGLALAQSIDGRDRRVVLINASSVSICRFYASNISRRTWEENILAGKIIRPGQRIRINIDDGTGRCLFDFRTVMCDGTELVRDSVNVCTIETYTIRD